MRVEYHPYFASQYEQLCVLGGAEEVAGEVTMLLDALERYGHEIEGEAPDDASHPIVISNVAAFALRRTPPTAYTPYATKPPVLRIPYVWYHDVTTNGELAVVMCIGNKTTLGHLWYPAQVQLIESRLAPEWERAHHDHRVLRRRKR